MSQTVLIKLLPQALGVVGFTIALSFSTAAFSLQDPVPERIQQSNLADPIRQLNLGGEQRQRIRLIYEENRDLRIRTNRQLVDAQLALEQTLDADSPSEDAVEQRIREVANAHAAQIRMRVMQELKIRKVLTREQVNIWRELRDRRQYRRRRLNNVRRGVSETQPNLSNQQDGLAPLLPPDQRRRRP